jgi:Leucine-rich repeat (LRR) protein
MRTLELSMHRRTHEYIKKTSPHLNLSKRGIRRVERDWLSDMLSVESLNLSFNAIQSLPEEFEVLTGLVSLDLVCVSACPLPRYHFTKRGVLPELKRT